MFIIFELKEVKIYASAYKDTKTIILVKTLNKYKYIFPIIKLLITLHFYVIITLMSRKIKKKFTRTIHNYNFIKPATVI